MWEKDKDNDYLKKFLYDLVNGKCNPSSSIKPEFYNRYDTYTASDFLNQFPMKSDEVSTKKVLSKHAWNTLCSWVSELIFIDGNQVDIMYSKRDKSEIRITIQPIESNGYGDGETYCLSEGDIGEPVLDKGISKILREVWNQKEFERFVSNYNKKVR